MNKEEFMTRLKELLADLPDDENKQDALNYYQDYLEVYDMAIDGRNRRYYKITEKGRVQLNLYRSEWAVYSEKIGRILEET